MIGIELHCLLIMKLKHSVRIGDSGIISEGISGIERQDHEKWEMTDYGLSESKECGTMS